MLIIVVLLKYKCTSSCLSGATKLIYLMLIVCWLKKPGSTIAAGRSVAKSLMIVVQVNFTSEPGMRNKNSDGLLL